METAGYDSSRPLAEQVAQRIKDYILEEKLKSGDKLPTETALAREMGVARSTVREAIKRLESQNILTVRHGAGSFVTDQPGLADDPLGLDFIEDKERLAFDLLEVRNIIEPAIAALAARHATPEDIAEMESLYNLMEYHILHGQDYLDEDMKKSKSNANSPHDGARCSCHAGCFSVLTQAAGCITTRQRCRPCDARRGSSTRAGSCSPPAPVPC